MSRLALGTAQFGTDSEHKGVPKIPAAEAGLILNIAHAARIDLLDTASVNSESESILGQCLKTHEAIRAAFRIVSKLPDLHDQKDADPAACLERTFFRLGIKNIYGYLVSNADNIKTHPQLLPFLKTAKRDGLVAKTGFLLRFPHEAQMILDEKLPCDLIHTPYSLFDRRFEPYFQKFRERGAEIHTRSVFLHGLLLRDPDTLPKFFLSIAGRLKKLRRVAAENNLGLSDLCIGFALANPHVDRVLCGVDSITNIKENVTAQARAQQVESLQKRLFDLRVDDENILLPARWRGL